MKISKNNIVINHTVNNAKNEAMRTSNHYTDSKISGNDVVIKQHIDNAKNKAINTAINDTDNKISENNTVIRSVHVIHVIKSANSSGL